MSIKQAVIRGLDNNGRGTWEENKDFIMPALDKAGIDNESDAELFGAALDAWGTREDVENYLQDFIDDEYFQSFGWQSAKDAVDDMLHPYAYGQYPWEVWTSDDGNTWFLLITM